MASNVNLGYHENENLIIKKVNGKEISNIQQLVGIVENSKDDFITFEDTEGQEIVIDRKMAETSNLMLLKTYRISSDRSDNLKMIRN